MQLESANYKLGIKDIFQKKYFGVNEEGIFTLIVTFIPECKEECFFLQTCSHEWMCMYVCDGALQNFHSLN